MRMLFLPPIVLLQCVAAMWALDRWWPLMEFEHDLFTWAGAALIVAGLAIANWHARLFKRVGTNIDTFGEPGRLTTAGLFSRTRNPMYLGLVMVISGAACWMGSLGALGVAAGYVALVHFWYIPIEERAMQAKFG